MDMEKKGSGYREERKGISRGMEVGKEKKRNG